eukprot:231600_1
MAEQHSSNLLAGSHSSQTEQKPYSLNIPPKTSKTSKKCICLTCRECTCCITGSVLSIILCAAGLLLFIFLNTKSVSTDALGQPSSVPFINHTIGSDFIYLKWKEPSQTGGAYITSYTLQYKYRIIHHASYTNWTILRMMDDGLGRFQNITHLNGSTHYIFRITAHNLAGYASNWSNISLSTNSPIAPQAPSAPFALNITSNRDKTYALTVAFTRNSNGGSPITKCSVMYGIYSNNTKYKSFCTLGTDALSQLNDFQYPNCTGTMTSDDLSQLFNFKVSCGNSVGKSPFSSVTPCIVPSQNPDYYMCLEIGPPDALSNGSFTLDVSSYEIDISWTEETCSGSAPISKYEVQRTDYWQNTGYLNVSLPYNGLSKTAEIDDVLAGLPYDIRVRSRNKYGASDWSYLFVQTAESANCGNVYDTKILRDSCKEFVEAAPAIWVKCEGNDDCQTKQFEKHWDFSANCTTCWVQLNDCAMDICVKECLRDFNTQQCKSCIMGKCSPETEICSGYPQWPIDCPTK